MPTPILRNYSDLQSVHLLLRMNSMQIRVTLGCTPLDTDVPVSDTGTLLLQGNNSCPTHRASSTFLPGFCPVHLLVSPHFICALQVTAWLWPRWLFMLQRAWACGCSWLSRLRPQAKYRASQIQSVIRSAAHSTQNSRVPGARTSSVPASAWAVVPRGRVRLLCFNPPPGCCDRSTWPSCQGQGAAING